MVRPVSSSKVARLSTPGKDRGGKARKPAPPTCPVTLIRCEADLALAFDLLQQVDPELVARLVAEAGPPPLRLRTPGLAGLAWIVVSQQVSTASANAIFGRLAARLPTFDAISLLALTDEDLRACGLSTPKRRTLHALAGAVRGGTRSFSVPEGGGREGGCKKGRPVRKGSRGANKGLARALMTNHRRRRPL